MNRDFYKDLSKWKSKSKRKPLVLRGARQVGKTYGVKSWGGTHFENVVYLNFEKDKKLFKLFEDSLSPSNIITNIINYLHVEIKVNKTLVFLDEIQLCGRALNSLKYFNEEMADLHVIAAGSLLGLVLNSEPFPVGKIEFLDIYPMSFTEFLEAINKENLLEIASEKNNIVHDRLVILFKHYLITGGCPEIVASYLELMPETTSEFDELRKKQEDLINSYLADMAKHCGKINAMSLERFWRNISEQLARESKSVSRFIFKDVLPKKNKYSQMTDVIDWLETAGLIVRVPIANQGMSPLSAYTKESIFKLYLFDVGILNALSGLSVSEILKYDFGTFKGYLIENFGLQEMVKLFGKKIFSWTEGSSEIDFLKEIGGEIIPIELKAGINLKAKSLQQYINKYHPGLALRFSLSPAFSEAKKENSKIRNVPLYLIGQKKFWEL